MLIAVKIVFLSLVGNMLYFVCSFIRNVRCVFISLHPSFSAQAGRLEVPGGLFAFGCVTFCYTQLDSQGGNQKFCLNSF